MDTEQHNIYTWRALQEAERRYQEIFAEYKRVMANYYKEIEVLRDSLEEAGEDVLDARKAHAERIERIWKAHREQL